ncbi:NADH-quinone oxidoreductase [Candidatus Phycorickettsia trachydisci]|uniref:NADH-quinone oxidoreductase subunit K n=1 Tax=Candidatus Phycorickettsia trachydisci TaxID=2115978 RepID=A0A2P1P8F6_9RICK|nr:NADH-quinone oxidoreductase subunit NuoK [Candidatus Phycorickettsia trachydisci]AVP87552.1 NADH-quinone oxidoreductase [Candidatus Phycorickettsia trachydisci]
MEKFIILSTILFSIGAVGVWINRKTIISTLLCIELMLLSCSINFVTFSKYLNDLTGQVVSIFILGIAASEAAVGLAIIVIYFRNYKTIEINQINKIKG